MNSKEIRRFSLKTGSLKDIDIKVDNYRVYVDHVNKRLYYLKLVVTKRYHYSIDYNGRSLKEMQLSEDNLGAIAVFGDFLYRKN